MFRQNTKTDKKVSLLLNSGYQHFKEKKKQKWINFLFWVNFGYKVMVSTKKRRLFGQKSGLLFQKGQLRLPLRRKCIRNIIICRCTDIEPG